MPANDGRCSCGNEANQTFPLSKKSSSKRNKWSVRITRMCDVCTPRQKRFSLLFQRAFPGLVCRFRTPRQNSLFVWRVARPPGSLLNIGLKRNATEVKAIGIKFALI
jgi:hypothetical protein